MQQVKQMVAAGVSLPTAIKEALGVSVTAFADKHGLSRQMTSERLNLERAPDRRTCDALALELGGDPFEWARVMWAAAEPHADEFTVNAA